MNIKREIERLQRMTVAELRQRWQELYGEPARSRNRIFLWRRLAWRIQEIEFGGLSERARRRAAELACDAELRQRLPRGAFAAEPLSGSGSTVAVSLGPDRRLPQAGTTLVKDYQGRRITVTVLEKGFEHEGRTYRSLSGVAKAITGTHWNGFSFFGLPAEAGR